jgi:chemotaxis signal transduction protein
MIAGMLVVEGPNAAWGIDASRVLGILSENEWFGSDPVDVGPWVGFPERWWADRSRILLVRGGAGEIAVRAGGVLAVRFVDPSGVQPLPELVMSRVRNTIFRGIVLSEKELPLFVIDADALSHGDQ